VHPLLTPMPLTHWNARELRVATACARGSGLRGGIGDRRWRCRMIGRGWRRGGGALNVEFARVERFGRITF
jgi:hypothetical protein